MAQKKKFANVEMTKAELEDLTVKELVELHNRISPGDKVSSFANKSTGVDKVWKMGEKDEKPAKEPKPVELDADGNPVVKEKKPRAIKEKSDIFNFPTKHTRDEYKISSPGTGMERLMIAMGKEGGSTFEELSATVGKTRNHIVGGIRWANAGLRYGVETLPNGNIHLVDNEGVHVNYEARPRKEKVAKVPKEKKAKAEPTATSADAPAN